MKEIFPNLFIGNQDDYESLVRLQDGWKVVHACKEPYHRRALGYSTRGAPKDHPEYLIAFRDNELILNMVDAADVSYIPKEKLPSAAGSLFNQWSSNAIWVSGEFSSSSCLRVDAER